MNNVLLNHYQACLDDYTRPTVLHGQCQQGINRWHKLSMVPCILPGGDSAELVIPERLQLVLHIPTTAPITAAQNINKSLMPLLLAGVLLSECERLEMRRLSNNLQSLFQRFREPGIKEQLVLLCWSELATGIDHNEWNNLHSLQPEALMQWTRQKLQTFWGLQQLTEEYTGLCNK
ncbi:TPA: malate transporter [Citrobacter werkmanii]